MQSAYPYKFPFASYPAVRLALLVIIGILFSFYLSPSLQALSFLTFSLITLHYLSEWINRRTYSILSVRFSILLYSLFLIFASSLYSQIRVNATQKSIENAGVLNLFEWDEIEVKGKIISSGNSSSGRPVYEIEVTETFFEKDLRWYHPFKIRLYGSDDVGSDIISNGKVIHAVVKIYSFPSQRNPHEFDYGQWLHNRGIAAHGELIEVLSVTNTGRIGWESIRTRVQANADLLFDEEHSHMAKALLLGFKDDLTPETRQQFSRSGLSHIMAVSGLHVGFIVAPFWFLIPLMWGSARGRYLGLFLLTLILLGYAGLTGFSPSVCRASLMAWFISYGKLFHKVRNSINLTAVAAIIVLFINPQQLFEIGFQLSFSAVFIILLIMKEAQELIPKRYRYGFKGGLISIILVSVVVQLGLFPILTYYFGEFSIIGPVANALVVPLLSFTVPAGLLFVLLSPMVPDALQAGVIPLQYSLNWVQWVAEYLGTQSYSFISIGERSFSIFLIWISAISWIASARIYTIRWKFLILLLCSLNLYLIERRIREPSVKSLEITVLDVGQADAIHISTPNGSNLLIDAGRWSPMSNSGDQILLPYFEHIGVDHIDAVLLSHPHADHIGGMPALLEGIEIGNIYQSDYDYESVLYSTYMNLAEVNKIPVHFSTAGDRIDIDPSLRIFVVGPEPHAPRDHNPNNHSLSFKLVYGHTSFLFSGDAETEQERRMTERYGDFLKSDLYKVGHHASNTSSSDLFMKVINPKITVSSLAFRNGFGHPGQDAITRLHQYSNNQFYTSLNGAIRFESDGEVIREVSWR
tara:strand:- start:19646 stop:22066 length:2421 start_codon:yes stop_codon:yes gene_type:complete